MDIQWATDLRDLPDVFANTRKGSDPTEGSGNVVFDDSRRLGEENLISAKSCGASTSSCRFGGVVGDLWGGLRRAEFGRMSAGELWMKETQCEPFNRVSRGHDHLSERDIDPVVLGTVRRTCVDYVFERRLGWVVSNGVLRCPCHCCPE